MNRLRTAPGARLTPFDLRQKERLLQDMIGGGQHPRQAADKLHCRIEIELGVAPIRAAWYWPIASRKFASLEGGTERLDPVQWNDARQQEKPLRVETQGIFSVGSADLCAPWEFVHRLDIRPICTGHQHREPAPSVAASAPTA